MPTNTLTAAQLKGAGIFNGFVIPASGGSSFTNVYSMEFDGGDEYFDLGTASNLEMTDDFSISVWIKDSSAFNRGIICCGDRSSTSGWMIYRNSSNKIVFSLYTVNNKTAISTSSINTGTWTNIIATFEKNGTASQQLKVYINGTLEGQGGWLSVQTPTYSGTIYKQIGFPYVGTNEFQGLIDEASIYNRLLTSQEISEISSTPIDLSSYSPLSWWRMGDGDTWNGSQWILTDNGSGGNDATSVLMEEADRVPISPNSYSQNSFVFDGSTDFVTLGNSSSLRLTADFSISCWMKFTDSGATRYALSMGDQYGIYTSAGTIRGFARIGGSFTALSSVGTFNDGNWHHVLYVKNATNMLLYIDGSLNASNTSGGINTSSTLDQRIGARYTNANYYDGSLDELYIFNSDQSGNISTIYGNGVPTDISSLNPLGHWRFGETDIFSTTWTFVDQGSGGNDGTSSTLPEEAKTGDQPYVL